MGHAQDNVNKILIGNKCDLDEKRVVTKELVKSLAEEYNIKFFETSAKNDTNVKHLSPSQATSRSGWWMWRRRINMLSSTTTKTQSRVKDVARYVSDQYSCDHP